METFFYSPHALAYSQRLWHEALAQYDAALAALQRYEGLRLAEGPDVDHGPELRFLDADSRVRAIRQWFASAGVEL